MCSVHLRMVELERNGQGGFEPRTFVLAPNHERIVENATIHTYCTINFILCLSPYSDVKGRGRYNSVLLVELSVDNHY